jgi:hypothetical protein
MVLSQIREDGLSQGKRRTTRRSWDWPARLAKPTAGLTSGLADGGVPLL